MSTFHISALPVELERDIFELAARMHRGSTKLHLAVVAHRVRIWIEPIIYETVSLDDVRISTFLRTVDCKSATFFAQHVKSLCIAESVTLEDAIRVLSVCTGVKNLAIWSGYETNPSRVLSNIISIRLERLSIPLPTLVSGSSDVDFQLPFYQDLTHLDIVDLRNSWVYTPISIPPRLTHLALSFSLHVNAPHILHQMLLKHKSLQVLVLCLDADDWDLLYAQAHLRRAGVGDPRVVTLSYSDFSIQEWESFLRGDPDRWARAEATVLSQRHLINGLPT